MKPTAPPLSDTERQVIALAAADLQDVALALRDELLRAHPNATNLAWPAHKIISVGFGPKKMSEHYAFIAMHPGHVNLGLYQGASLPAIGPALRHADQPLESPSERFLGIETAIEPCVNGSAVRAKRWSMSASSPGGASACPDRSCSGTLSPSSVDNSVGRPWVAVATC
ncbi:hypothetical protein [Roseateles amylovorans]|uniref:DUF1801 domain-containing protein n=1 Tax=Roseateles amylovorans TaxID=2978473 RepID=A0ABY6AZS9_9BURK|nr:hypothetical protein [Roseateles amylovorans]UXH77803.1 hypothetical protein N4261_22970 [Roseateles amylovorans]